MVTTRVHIIANNGMLCDIERGRKPAGIAQLERREPQIAA
jgi:hypothetical protein